MPHICWGYFEKRGIGLNTKLKAPERGIFLGPENGLIKYVNQLDLMVDNGIYGVSVYSSTHVHLIETYPPPPLLFSWVCDLRIYGAIACGTH